MEGFLKTKLLAVLAKAATSAERLLRGSRTPDPSTVKSVLILEYRLPLGCCVHLTPLYEAIKKSRPEIELTVATRGLAANLLRHHPYVDHLIETPDALVDTLAAVRELRSQLKRRGIHPDCIFTGASDNRTRISLLAILAGRGWRAGYTLVPQLYHHPLIYKPDRSLIDNNLRLAELAGCGSQHREPAVFFSATDAAVAKSLAEQVNPSSSKPLLILVTQPSGGQSTGWHQERFAEVARVATEELGCALAYVGIQADHASIETLRAAANGAGANLAGRTSITELAALLSMSDYLISLDTGTMHLGRAVGLPLVVLGPSWQKPIEWLPLGQPRARVIRGADRPDIPSGYRLDEISPADVLDALRNLMAAYPPSAEARASRVANGLATVDHLDWSVSSGAGSKSVVKAQGT